MISILAIAIMALLPRTTYGSTTTEVEEQPHVLPLQAAAAVDTKQYTAGEFWQEDEHEVLIRRNRGAKNNNGANNGANNGSGSGKREKNKRVNNRKKSDDKDVEKIEKVKKACKSHF